MDVAHLRDISEVDTHTIFVDSAQRDKLTFPTPAEYEIVFDSPFQNVVGFDILDCSIPATSYVVDEHNNRLAVSYRTGGTPGATGRAIPELLRRMQASASFAAVAADAATPEHRVRVVGRHGAYRDAARQDGSSRHAVYDSAVGLTLLSEAAARAAEAAGGEALQLGGGAPGEFARVDFYEDAGSPTGYAWAVAKDGAPAHAAALAVVEGLPCAVLSFTDALGTKAYAYCSAADLCMVPLRDVVSLSVGGEQDFLLEGSYHVPVSEEGYESLDTYVHEYSQYNLTVSVGNHDTVTLAAAIMSAMPRFSPTGLAEDMTEIVNVTSFSGAQDYGVDRRIKYTGRDFFWFDMQKSTIADVLGFSEAAAAGKADFYDSMAVPGNAFLFGALEADGAYELFTPGLTNLYGERFVVLRCPQIEENNNASLSFEKASAGIGVFKIYNATQVAHLRFDFTTLAKLDMHPIGKLAKLRLRFERVSGELYNFRGADHHLFVALKFLKPHRKPALVEPERRLNPDYDPDIMRFLTTYLADDLDESSSEEDEALLEDVAHRQRFLARRRARLCPVDAQNRA